MRCTVLGGGSYGTALAVHLAGIGHDVVLWDRHPERVAAMNAGRRNPRYLRDIPWPDLLHAESSLPDAVTGADLVVPCVPSHAYRAVLTAAAPHLTPGVGVCCATKGIEEGTLATMAEVGAEVLGDADRLTVLSGPTFAAELARGLPSTVVVAGPVGASQRVADTFHGGSLRVYHSHDVVGVCVGGSLKNVMAIACGISDGLGLGQNTRAALITRGLAEITRLAVAMGAEPMTLAGLAGLGDLVLTCTGDQSRNRRVGLALGSGRTLDDILRELGEVAEGVVTARSAHHLGRKVGVELPITEQVHAMIHEGRSAAEGLARLMGRERKAEH